jgi:hypothetical protein
MRMRMRGLFLFAPANGDGRPCDGFPRPLLFIDQITYRLTTLTFRNAASLSIKTKSR